MTRDRRLHPTGAVARTRRQTGSDVVDRLANTPAGEEFGAEVIELARQLAAMQPDLGDDDREALVMLVVASLVSMREGSTRLPLGDDEDTGYLRDVVETFLPERGEELVERIHAVIGSDAASLVIGGPDDYRPLIVEDGWLYHQRLRHYEVGLSRGLAARLKPTDGRFDDDPLREGLEEILARPPKLAGGQPMMLSGEQQYAVLTAVQSPLTVVTGGPGTGKTSIVVSLLRLLSRLGISTEKLALAAPTGKAANRLGESIDTQLGRLEEPATSDEALVDEALEPQTLHRLLGYSYRGGNFRRDEDDPLEADWVIVDEASMIDVVLMERLLRALRPEAHLVLLGDAEQLPSVESGTVLRDLVPEQVATDTSWRALGDGEVEETTSTAPGARQVVRLTHNYRMDDSDPAGHAILAAADRIRGGHWDELRPGSDDGLIVRDGVEDLTLQGVEWIRTDPEQPGESRESLLSLLEFWFESRLRALDDFDALTQRNWRLDDGGFAAGDVADIDRLFDHYNRFRILCLTRVWTTGADSINDVFHRRVLQRAALEGRPQFVAGEPVIMLRNDYDRGLFNGDQGLVLRVVSDDDARLMAVFPTSSGYEAHNLPALRGHLDHAFAMTVHKAQGSEFDEVAIVLPEEDLPLVSREILYTGVTRSRRGVAIIGHEDVLRTAVGRPVRRFSGIAERLRRNDGA